MKKPRHSDSGWLAFVSAVKVPSAQRAEGYCLNILLESLVVGEGVVVRDKTGRLKAEIIGKIPSTLPNS
jgi:hypothetical protein